MNNMIVNIILKDGTLLRKVKLFKVTCDDGWDINSSKELINYLKTNSHISYCGEYVNGKIIVSAIESYSIIEE